MYMRQLALLCCSVAVAGTAWSCGSSTAPSGPPRLGLKAGTVTSADGKATVDVPAGALPKNVPISVSPSSDTVANARLVTGTAYDLEPNGTVFSRPLTLTISYDPSKIPDDETGASLALYHLVNGSWQRVSASRVDTTAHKVSGPIDSFSNYAIFVTSLISKSLAAGDAFTCALNDVGAAFCWGEGKMGQLGDGTNTSLASPTQVAGGHTYTAIAAGGETACGLVEDGTVECWGVQPGALGRRIAPEAQPVQVGGTVRFSTLSVGTLSACGIAISGGAYCWGDNQFGELGIGAADTSVHVTPIAVLGGDGFIGVSAGVFNDCALQASGAAFCWGDNGLGELGIGQLDSTTVPHPAPVSGGITFTSVAAAAAYACGISAGATECWGNNLSGQLGGGLTVAETDSPNAVIGGQSFTAVFASGQNSVVMSTCALDSTGAAFCWGNNDNGQLGAPSTSTCEFQQGFPCSLQPLAVQGGFTFGTLAVGDAHTCGMTTDRKVYCWGDNSVGQLGDGTMTNAGSPVLSLFTALAVSGSRGLARVPVERTTATPTSIRRLIR